MFLKSHARIGVAAAVVGLTLSGCGNVNYLVRPSPGQSVHPKAAEFQQAADVRYHEATAALERAAASEEAALARRPGWALGYAQLAKIFWHLGQGAAAFKAAQKAASLAPTSAQFAVSLGFFALSQKRASTAQAAFAQGLKMSPGDWQAMDGLAAVAVQAHHFRRAQNALRRALQAGGPQGLTYQEWGELEVAEQRWVAAMTYFEDAHAAQPTWWRPWYAMAMVQRQWGQKKTAVADLEHALQLNPGQGTVWWALQTVHQGSSVTTMAK